jgi:hypothetical protein
MPLIFFWLFKVVSSPIAGFAKAQRWRRRNKKNPNPRNSK